MHQLHLLPTYCTHCLLLHCTYSGHKYAFFSFLQKINPSCCFFVFSRAQGCISITFFPFKIKALFIQFRQSRKVFLLNGVKIINWLKLIQYDTTYRGTKYQDKSIHSFKYFDLNLHFHLVCCPEYM